MGGEKELLELMTLLGSKGLTMSTHYNTLGIIPVIVRKGGVGGSCFLQQFLDALTVLKRESEQFLQVSQFKAIKPNCFYHKAILYT